MDFLKQLKSALEAGDPTKASEAIGTINEISKTADFIFKEKRLSNIENLSKLEDDLKEKNPVIAKPFSTEEMVKVSDNYKKEMDKMKAEALKLKADADLENENIIDLNIESIDVDLIEIV